MFLPKPAAPRSGISPPGEEEEGCDRQPGWFSIIQAGLLLTSACFTQTTSLPNLVLYLTDRLYERFAVTCACAYMQGRMQQANSRVVVDVSPAAG